MSLSFRLGDFLVPPQALGKVVANAKFKNKRLSQGGLDLGARVVRKLTTGGEVDIGIGSIDNTRL